MKTITDAQYEEYQALREFRYRIILLGFKAAMWIPIVGGVIWACWAAKSS